MNRIVFLATAICLALFALSCHKKDAGDQVAQNANARTYRAMLSSGPYSNYFGVLVNASAPDTTSAYTSSGIDLNPTKSIQLAQTYGVGYYRMNLFMDRWNDNSNNYQYRNTFISNYSQVAGAGLSVLLNLNSTSPAYRPAPFPDSGAYAIFVRSVLDNLPAKPGLVVIENEESNDGYFTINGTSSVLKYIQELYAGANVCNSYAGWGSTGVPVTNGGITCRLLTLQAWDWMKNVQGWTAGAQSYAYAAMSPSFYYALYPNAPNKPANVTPRQIAGINAELSTGKAFMNGYSAVASKLSYINIHWYEPARVRGWTGADGGSAWTSNSRDAVSYGALDSAVLYLNARLPSLPVITNETGQLSHSPCLTASMFLQYIRLGFPVVSWYDGDGGKQYDSKALHNTISSNSSTLRPAGTAFQSSAAGNIPVCN